MKLTYLLISLSISVILIHFSETSFSLACFINWHMYLKNMIQVFLLEYEILFHLFFFLFSPASFSFIVTSFFFFIISISSFSVTFSCLSITVFGFYFSFGFPISLGLTFLYIYLLKKFFCNNLHILRLHHNCLNYNTFKKHY